MCKIPCLEFYLILPPSLKTLEDICSLHMITLNQGNTIYQVLTIFCLFLLGNYIWPDMSQKKNVLIHSNALWFNWIIKEVTFDSGFNEHARRNLINLVWRYGMCNYKIIFQIFDTYVSALFSCESTWTKCYPENETTNSPLLGLETLTWTKFTVTVILNFQLKATFASWGQQINFQHACVLPS